MFYNYFLGVSTLIVLLSMFSAWSYRSRIIRWSIIFVLIVVTPVIYFSILDLLSRPKPISMETVEIKYAEVLGFKIIQDKYIFILLDFDIEPRYYVILWNKSSTKMVKELQEGWRKKQKRGGSLKMVKPFGNFDSTEKPRFIRPSPPQNNAPLKPHTGSGVPEYNIGNIVLEKTSKNA